MRQSLVCYWQRFINLYGQVLSLTQKILGCFDILKTTTSLAIFSSHDLGSII
ncbi:hypothetical protein SAMN05660405_02687 [Psychrobacter pacificensis]|uniref:Uncharacterized protein n=1 Tax=Psychrobacter pacificensis TaxID=112002 RepID=A0A1G7B456_9GAMM|nr:hypothetical protein SAMN05660405_02687 [Psychrobacter pacificensis]